MSTKNCFDTSEGGAFGVLYTIVLNDSKTPKICGGGVKIMIQENHFLTFLKVQIQNGR